MENNTTLQEMLNWANKEYYPLNWVIEGPYLYINNYGQEINKEDGYAHFPSIKAIRDIKYLIEDATKYIKRQSEFLLTAPTNRIPDLTFTNENELQKARHIYETRN